MLITIFRVMVIISAGAGSNYKDLNNVSKKFKNLYTLGSSVLIATSFFLVYFGFALLKYYKIPVFYNIILIFMGLLIAMVLLNIYTDHVVNSCIPINVNGNTVYVMNGVTRIKIRSIVYTMQLLQLH